MVDLRVRSINILSNAGISAAWVFVPIFAMELGAADWQVGLVVGSWGTARLMSSFIFGRVADIYGRRIVLWLGLAAAAIAFSLQGFANSPLTLALVRGSAGFTAGIFPAALYAYIHDAGHKVGKFTAYEALGWGIGSIIAGITTIYWSAFFLSLHFSVYWGVFLFSGFVMFASFIISLKLTRISAKHLIIPRFPVELIKKNGNIYLAYLIRHTAAMSIWTIFPLFLRDLGASLFWIAMISVVNAVAQFIIMHYLDRFDTLTLIAMGILVASITFMIFAVSTDFYQVLLLHVMIALSWSSMYVGSLNYLLENNEEKATSTGLLNSAVSLAGITGPLLGGAIAQLFGYRAVMFNAAALAFLSFIIFVALSKKSLFNNKIKANAA